MEMRNEKDKTAQNRWPIRHHRISVCLENAHSLAIPFLHVASICSLQKKKKTRPHTFGVPALKVKKRAINGSYV